MKSKTIQKLEKLDEELRLIKYKIKEKELEQEIARLRGDLNGEFSKAVDTHKNKVEKSTHTAKKRRKKYVKLNDKDRAEVVELYEKGKTKSSIARRFKVSPTTVATIIGKR